MAQSRSLIPQVIEQAYYPQGIADQAVIPGGEVNLTFKVTDTEGGKTILQRLSPIYDQRVGKDYEVVAAHLRAEGWEMATALKTSEDATYLHDDDDQLWRAFNYIESTPGRELEGDLEASTALGGLLGTLHQSLASLNYTPTYSRTGIAHAKRLELLIAELPDSDTRALAAAMITMSHKDSIGSQPSQVIHADPRIGNALFRDGKPFTFIDWDGYKRANPLVDIGDCLQSTIGEVLTKGAGSGSTEQFYPMLEAYHDKAGVKASKPLFMQQALAAGRVIALDLGMRHLIDSVEDRYFVWDSNRFESRLAFNMFCAERQWQVYEMLC